MNKSTKLLITEVVCLAFVVLFAGCQRSNQTGNNLETISISKTTTAPEPTTNEMTTAELTAVETTTIEATTEVQTTMQKTNEDTLKEGMWISYSPQDVVFDAYVFSDDGILEKTGYSLTNGNVQEYMSVVFQTYRIRGNQILITDKNGNEWTWYFTDDEDILDYSYTDSMGGEKYTISQKIRHHDSLPDYNTAMTERKKD